MTIRRRKFELIPKNTRKKKFITVGKKKNLVNFIEDILK